ncbi:MAG: hypothetical protein F6K23_34480 [Okeania sp. SIO2C9]|uniref:hypothetical protein n=1 Tax=Okeania sp. SIO2C9 TaxID=2607791 RepID=UPI0013C29228|nr:hypothetical protein [Okeania sp. SIO2C9]NEQ77676.1 hypothetical protein [Okeania sp. SIO2C9]
MNISGSTIVARKPHIPFYANSKVLRFPNVGTLEELRNYLESHSSQGKLFLYCGSSEKNLRPQFKILASPEKSPDWLKIEAQSTRPGLWAFYRYNPE